MNHLHFQTEKTRASQRGSALLAVVPAIVLVMALLMAFVGSVTSASQSAEQEQTNLAAESAARAVISLAVEGVWSDFAAVQNVDTAQPWDFQQFLEQLGFPDQSEVDAPQGVDIAQRLTLPVDDRGRATFGGAIIESIEAYRIDNWDSTALVVEVTVAQVRGMEDSSRTMRHAVREIFTIAPPAWDGLDYALLATNINCILCHTNIDSAQRFYNTDPELYGTFDQVKLGTIDSLHFRSDPSSSIAGSLYVGGDAMEGDGESISNWSKFNLKSVEVDADGKIVQDDWGGTRTTNMARPDASDPDKAANLYLGADNEHSDGFLPSSFPSPFPDNGGVDEATGEVLAAQAGNRIVDDEEFMTTVARSKGTVSGGRISIVEPGSSIDKSSELSALRNGAGDLIDGLVNGNVYLHGEKNDPLRLDGDIAIDGDVIISGYVLGDGAIRARGNVYIPADLIYADGSKGGDRTYGKAADGSPNNLAIAAGGNIVVGDFYRPAWGKGSPATGGKDGSFNFVMDEVAIFNRMEWIKTQPTLPGAAVKVQVGTKTVIKDEYKTETYVQVVAVYKNQKTGNKIQQPVYKNVTTTTGKPPYQTTTTTKVLTGYKTVDEYKKVQVGTKSVTKTRSVKTGNKITEIQPVYEWQTPQHPNPYYAGADHIARYYTFDEGQPAPIFNKQGYFDPNTGHWMSEERAEDWDDSKLSYADPSKANDPFLYAPDGSPIAVLSTLTPTGGWVAPDEMQKLIDLNLAQRGPKKTPFEINATLYSANAIMGVVGNLGSDHTDGRLHVNGGLVASDIGVLAAEGTQINYDGRGSESLSITSDRGLTIRRSATLPLPRS
ncbi:MAG: hypothetical protein R3F49_04420 [Planctomycetota bacterium]